MMRKKDLLTVGFGLLMRKKCVFTIIAVSAIISGITPIRVYALVLPDATYWQGPSNLEADWFSGSNWDKGVPGPSDDVAIDNGGIAQITSGTAVAGSLYLAPGTTIYPSPGWQMKEGYLVQSGGSLTISNKLDLSATGGTSSSYKLIDGNLSSQELRLGGNSLFQQSGGNNSTGNLTVNSTYKFESGTLMVTGDERIISAGVFEHTGGNHVADYIELGSYFDNGHYVLSGGSLDAFFLSGTDNSTVEHSGGSSVVGVLDVGSYSLSQANANIPSSLTTEICSVAEGTFTQSGGLHNALRDQLIIGLYTLSGGTNIVSDQLEIRGGTYRMTGGSLTASNVTVGNTYGDGTLEVASGCTVSVKGHGWLGDNTIRTFGNSSVDLTQGGKVLVGNVDTSLTGAITIGIDGVLEGTGTIIGNVSNQGIVRSGWRSSLSSGYSPGTLTITGDYEQELGGTLALFIAGIDVGSFSLISIDGQADIAGELSLSLIDGFVPNVGDTFEILQAGSCYGNFSLLNVIGLPDDMFFDIEYGVNNVILEVIPEPATLLLFSLGGILLRKRHM